MRSPAPLLLAAWLVPQVAACPSSPTPEQNPVPSTLQMDGGDDVLRSAGETVQLRLRVTMSDRSVSDVTGEALWQSGTPSVATVNASGLLTAVSTGTARVTAIFGGLSASKEVAVNLVIASDWTYLGPVYDGEMLTEVGQLLVDPRDDRLLYVVVDGRGVYVSHDRGATWTPGPNDVPGERHPLASARLASDPNAPDRVLFARGSGVWLTEDHGATWRLLFRVPSDADGKYLGSLDVSALDGAILATASYGFGEGHEASGFGAFRSTDGVSWTFSPFGDERFLIVWDTAEDPIDGTLYAPAEIADHPQPYDPPWYRSRDRGLTWHQMPNPSGWHALSTVVDPITRAVYVLSEGAGLYRSTTQGDSWERLGTERFFGQILLDPVVPGRMFAGTIEHPPYEGGTWVSEDGGLTFAPAGLQGRKCGSIALSGSRLFASCYESGIYVVDAK